MNWLLRNSIRDRTIFGAGVFIIGFFGVIFFEGWRIYISLIISLIGILIFMTKKPTQKVENTEEQDGNN